MDNGARPEIPGIPEPAIGTIAADGTFRIDNAMPGEYRILIGMRAQYYIKEARFGTTDILNSPFLFTGREPGSLNIVISPNVAALGAQVVLIPDRARYRPELFRTARTDQTGRFVMTNIAPGDYRLYAWEAIEPYGWFDMELAARYEQFATRLRLGESSRQSVNLRVIPNTN